MKKTITFCCLILISIIHGFGQNQWYFGQRTGLDFTNASNNSRPVSINNHRMISMEGGAMAFDANKNVILYSGGDSVWYVNPQGQHINITTDSTLVLRSTLSTTQSCLFLPLSCTQYAVVSVKTWDVGDSVLARNALFYSIITIANGTASITRPRHILNSITHPVYFSEKLAAYHRGNNKYWLVAHDYNKANTSVADSFYVFDINDSILINTPIKRKIIKIGKGFNGDFWQSVGQMKFSKDGKRLATINSNILQVYDVFNQNQNNIDSFKLRENFPYDAVLASVYRGYGLEFASSDSLYFTDLYNKLNLYRLSNNAVIYNISVANVPNLNAYLYGSLQMGPDGFLYMSRGSITIPSNHVVRINVSNHHLDSIIMSERVYVGLPNIVSNLNGCGISCNPPSLTTNNLPLSNTPKAAACAFLLSTYRINVGNLSSNATYTLLLNGAPFQNGNIQLNNPVLVLTNLTEGNYTLTVSIPGSPNCSTTRYFCITKPIIEDPRTISCKLTCCIPNALNNRDLVMYQFKKQFVDERAGKYKLTWDPLPNYSNLLNQWYNTLQAEANLLGCRSLLPLMTSIKLYQINNIAPGTTESQILNSAFETDPNIGQLIESSTGQGLNSVLEPGKYYIITVNHQINMGLGRGMQICGSSTKFLAQVVFTGGAKLIKITTDKTYSFQSFESIKLMNTESSNK